MPTPKEYFLNLDLRKKLLLPTLALLAIFGVCFLLVLTLQLDRGAERQSQHLGHSLARQLAQQARQSLLQNDGVSLQVLINTLMENNPQVHQVVVFNQQDKAWIKSDETSSPDGRAEAPLGPYREDITMAGAQLGRAEITINGSALRDQLGPVFALALSSWIGLGVLLCLGLNLFANDLTRRLNKMRAALPMAKTAQTRDELSQLENTLRPLLVMSGQEQACGNTGDTLVLTLCARNLSALKSQLTHRSYHNLISGFDAAINATAKLFEASRSGGTRDCLHLTFTDSADSHGAVSRAICCFAALSELLHTGPIGPNAGLSVSAVLKPIRSDPALSQFEQQQFHQGALSAAESLACEATKGQLLIAMTLVETPTASGADADRGSNPGSGFNFENHGLNLVRFVSLQEPQQAMLEAQLAFLRSQLLNRPQASAAAS